MTNEHKREPLIRIAKRNGIQWWKAWIIRLAAIFISLISLLCFCALKLLCNRVYHCFFYLSRATYKVRRSLFQSQKWLWNDPKLSLRGAAASRRRLRRDPGKAKGDRPKMSSRLLGGCIRKLSCKFQELNQPCRDAGFRLCRHR